MRLQHVKNKLFLFAWVSAITLIFSCKKDKVEISNVPEIKLVEVSPTQIREYKDKIVFNVYYKDGDGDIGENADGVKNLFVTDSRNQITYQFRVKQLSPSGAGVAIEGNLMVELNNAAILDGSSSQAVEYSLYLKDRAGNSSNIITTSGLSVIK